MFKDGKSGGYNLEQCQGNDKRLLSLILLIAIAYTCAIKKGQTINFKGIKEYVCRLEEDLRKDRRHSNFWVGLYGGMWVESFQICHEWFEQLMILTPNKLPFYQQGIRAKGLPYLLFNASVTPGGSQLKAFLRQFSPTTSKRIGTLIKIAMNLMDPKHLRNWFAHCCYSPS